jgi:4-amino-4-deoxy-L-arabinose transferase-like glycosyltransferase
MRELGSYRTPMFAYVLLPFQALGGMNLWTNRLPAALGGLVTILLIYWVGARLFDRPTGLAAAALLALNPVHIQLSRYGNESCLTPLLALAPLAAWLWMTATTRRAPGAPSSPAS